MRNLISLTRRELGSLFLSPSLHVVTAFFVLVYSLYFCFRQERASTFEPLTIVVCIMSMFLVPLITMRCFAEETQKGTMELLLTAPVGAGEVVLSKFLGCLAFYVMTLLAWTAYVGQLAAFGNPDRWLGDLDSGEVWASVLALVLVGALFTAIGVFVSSLTSSQVVAAAATLVSLWILLLLAIFEESGDVVAAGFGYISFVPHFKRFLPGVIDTRDVTYFLTFGGCMLILTWLVVRSRGMLARMHGASRRVWGFGAGLSAGVGFACLLFGVARLHINDLSPRAPLSMLSEGETATAFGYLVPLLLGVLGLLGAAVCLYLSRVPGGGRWLAALRHGDAGPTLLGAVCILAIAVNLNYFAASSWDACRGVPGLALLRVVRHRYVDISDGKANTLHADTRATLDELTAPVDFYVFYSEDVDYQGVDLLDEMRQLLTLFSAYSPFVHVTYADPVLEPEKSMRLAKKLDLEDADLTRMALAVHQGRRVAVPPSLVLKAPGWKEQMAGIKTPKFNGEHVLTLGLKRLMDPRITRVYWAKGHGEMAIDSSERQPGSAGALAQALRQDGFDVHSPLLSGNDPIPIDCNVLVLAGPRVPLGGLLVQRIQEYVERGGRLLLLLPSVTSIMSGRDPDHPPDAELLALLKRWGCSPSRDMIIDQQNNDGGRPGHIHVVADRQHPITRAGRSVVCVIPYSRSLRIDPKIRKRGWIVERLLVSAESAVAKERVGEGASPTGWQTREGPFTVAMASAKPPDARHAEARVVVVGNAEFVSNLSLEKGHNKAFILSALHWLAGRDYDIRVPPKEYVDRSLNLTGRQKRVLLWVSLAALPLAWLFVGALVWWARRQ